MGTATPARNRKSGAANPPITLTTGHAAFSRAECSVQASNTCHSIIDTTAIPRSQSM